MSWKAVKEMFVPFLDVLNSSLRVIYWRLISSSTTWDIWLLRNNIIFKEKTINLFDCFSIIVYRAAIWLHALNSNFIYIENNLLRFAINIKLWYNKKS